MIELRETPEGTIISVRVQTKARHTGIAGIHDGSLRIAVTEVAEKGKANRAVAKVLANEFGLPPSSIELVSGPTSRQKSFLLCGVPREKVCKMAERLVSDTAS